MDAASYDGWYETPRGHWIGETEYRLVSRILDVQTDDSLLDVGCGTGWFTRRFFQNDLRMTGIDPDPQWISFAKKRGPTGIDWIRGDARSLPFRNRSYDRVFSVSALCFVEEERQAVSEIVRVTKRRFAIGWLNRDSLLYRKKGGGEGVGSYRGARWHSPDELSGFFASLPIRDLRMHSAVFLPSGSKWARTIENVLPNKVLSGALLIVSGERR
uniref:ORF213 n=1 Tax=Leptospirillum ferrooxidans TaxID=180 RepID=Q58KD7_9BACT|nr:class I SAM-dependent methyltransferase [Leptospirillum ferrooxidans]AAX38528.1 ORF213 [Leptospirillum ferrooxidans]